MNALTAPPGAVDEAGLRNWGRELGAALRAPVVIALHGDLGAGKTTLAQAVAHGAGVAEEVTSPTFALVHEYPAPSGTVYHLDLYRLQGPDDLTNLAWDEIVDGPAGLVLIEWPERAGARLPARRLDIKLTLSEARADHRHVEMSWTA